jgi:hypothetical protein
MVVDRENRHVVEVLPTRSAMALRACLEPHPGVTVGRRARQGVKAEGACRGAPGALPVGDRLHRMRIFAKVWKVR